MTSRWFSLGCVVALAGACGGHHAAPPPPRAMPVDLVTLQTTRVVDASEYLATLRSRTAATLQPQVEGQVVAILVKAGDLVKPGQPLVRIDPGAQPSAVAQESATRAARQAQLALAQRNLERVQRLVTTGALPQQELDNARAAVEAAKGDVEALGAQIAGSRVQLGYYQILAPGAGVVGDIPVRVGDRVTPQSVITTVTDNSVLEANISVPVDRASALQRGMDIQLVDETSQIVGGGKLGFISPLVSSDTQSVLVKADIDNSAGKLRAEQVVRARIVWSTHDGVTVPALAVTRQGGQPFVFVAVAQDGGMVAHQRPVQLGALTNNAFVVASGVKAGERVVTSGIQKLRDGVPIVKAPPKAAGAGSGTGPAAHG